MLSFHIHIRGQVQGVGFRPFIFTLARQMGVVGTVSNGTDGVHIHISVAEKYICEGFVYKIFEDAPGRSEIISVDITELDHQVFSEFSILNSEQKDQRNVHLSPDFGICENCKSELYDRTNRRFHYPFITCTQCGPRLSVLNDIPYDRALTSMSRFTMCPQCKTEYNNPGDRRYYSQTNSCTSCGVKLSLLYHKDIEASEIQNYVDKALKQGKIVAVKSIGGYLLLCDASSATAIRTLRDRKKRPGKPFALMYPDLGSIHQDVILTNEAIKEIESTAFPIVLGYKKDRMHSNIRSDLVAPDLSQLGVMLPNNPLLSLISARFGGPLVATSANISGSPMIYEDSMAQDLWPVVADVILGHDRDIVVPQDDSVIRYTPFLSNKIILRRSRGYTPTYWPNSNMNIVPILCTGADMKSVFLIANGHNIYLSQFLGDLSTYESQVTYEHVLHHYLKITSIKPKIIVRDKHPLYYLPDMVNTNADAFVYTIQHHKAHFCACLFENDLLLSNDSVLGVIWDGVGYGNDGQMWGGEFFVFENKKIERVHHINYFDYLLGDKMSLQPRLAALSWCKDQPEVEKLLRHKFTDQEWVLYNKMLIKPSAVKTSSMGRIFDAVASLLGISDINSYEGESAMLLEDHAYRFLRHNGLSWNGCYFCESDASDSVCLDNVIKGIMGDIGEGKEVGMIAAKFHITLVRLIENIARKMAIKSLVFSGGVFQNGLLVDLIHHHLGRQYSLYFQKNVSPNDENIALGQMAYYLYIDDGLE